MRVAHAATGHNVHDRGWAESPNGRRRPAATLAHVARHPTLAALLLVLLLLPTAGATAQIGPGFTWLGEGEDFAISADGGTVTFAADQPRHDSRGTDDGWVYRAATDTFELLDVTPGGSPSPSRGPGWTSLDADGSHVTFTHPDPGLDASGVQGGTSGQNLYVRDLTTGTTTLHHTGDDGQVFPQAVNNPVISADGRFVVFRAQATNTPLDSDVDADIGCICTYVRDLATGEVEMVSVTPDNTNPDDDSGEFHDLSADGRYVVFESEAGDLLDGPPLGPAEQGRIQLYVRDRQTGATRMVTGLADGSRPSQASRQPTISDDGRFVAFESVAPELAGEDGVGADVFLWDAMDGTHTLISHDRDGTPANGGVGHPAISPDGRYVAFTSTGLDLAGPEVTQPSRAGVYRYGVLTSTLARVDVAPDGTGPNGNASSGATPAVASSGVVVFHSVATNLNPQGIRGLHVAASTDDEPPAPPPTPGPDPQPDLEPQPDVDAIITTAIEVSQRRFGDTGFAQLGGPAQWAVLATARSFADSLSGAVLTQTAPLLYTEPDGLDPRTGAELDRVLGGTGTVYLLGGDAALSPAVEAAVTAAGYTVDRLAGASRFQTSVAIADEAIRRFGPTGTVALARAFGPEGNPTAAWADSVTGGGWAADRGTPIVLTPSESLHPDVAAWLDRVDPQQTVLLGGTAALHDAVAQSVPGPNRVFGPNRSATAVAIAEQLWAVPSTGQRAYFVINATHADGWAYGLAAAGLAADIDAPLLATGAVNPPETLAAVQGCGGQVSVSGIGPSDVLPASVLAELDAQDAMAC
ncbi:MAG TPA: cell wall-binding repeat-containing protein [Euzebya sp.]|nr:cell wall-binding repeat-containing protein [Euzebya sp.]